MKSIIVVQKRIRYATNKCVNGEVVVKQCVLHILKLNLINQIDKEMIIMAKDDKWVYIIVLVLHVMKNLKDNKVKSAKLLEGSFVFFVSLFLVQSSFLQLQLKVI